MSDLVRTQQRLWQLLTAPDGVRAALASRGDPSGRSLEGLLVSDARASAALRLEVYANAYFERIHDVLASDFEALAHALGEAGFHDLVTAYLCVHTPTRPSLRHAGQHLADFLAGHPAARPFRRRWPWAADLARLEWTLADAFDAADAAALERDQLAAVAPERWQDLALALAPCARRLALAWDVAPLRVALEAGGREVTPPGEPVPCTLLVWRRDERVMFRPTDAEEHALLGLLEEGATFGALCAWLAERHGDESAPARAAERLSAWVEAQLLVLR
jgi:hypothetical protein